MTRNVRTRLRIAIVAAALVMGAACGANSPSPSPFGPSSGGGSGGPPAPLGTFAFVLDGVQHSASRVTATYSGGILAVTASEGAQQTTLGFALTGSAAATYQIGPLTRTNASLQVGDPARAWQAGSSVGSGSVTLTMLTPLLAVGTFTFSMEPVAGSGATGTRLVTDGVFNVTIG